MRAWMQRWRTRSPARPTRPAARLRVESLEAREVPALTSDPFQVTTTTAGDQFDTANASSANGLSVAVWAQRVDGGNSDVRAQMFNPDGTKRGGEIVVAGGPRSESQPAVAMDNAGNWKVVWTERVTSSNRDLKVASFDSNGNLRRTVFTAAKQSENESDPSIAVDAVGNFVVAYTFEQFPSTDQPIDFDVVAARFTDRGSLLGRFAVGGSRNFAETNASVARAKGSDGKFAIAYQRDFLDDFSTDNDIVLRRYSAAGESLSNVKIAGGLNNQLNPQVAIDNGGRTAVVWQELVGSDFDILARRVTSTGGLDPTITVANTTADETLPVVAMDRSDGDFVVAWQTGSSIRLREYNRSSTPKGVAVTVDGNGANPFLSIDGRDFYFVTFTSSARTGDPGLGVYGRYGQLV